MVTVAGGPFHPSNTTVIGATKRAMTRFADAIKNHTGATAIEYALLGGLIAVVIVAALTLIGADIGNTFNAVANAF